MAGAELLRGLVTLFFCSSPTNNPLFPFSLIAKHPPKSPLPLPLCLCLHGIHFWGIPPSPSLEPACLSWASSNITAQAGVPWSHQQLWLLPTPWSYSTLAVLSYNHHRLLGINSFLWMFYLCFSRKEVVLQASWESSPRSYSFLYSPSPQIVFGIFGKSLDGWG